MVINTTKILHDSTLWIRDKLLANVTDPLAASRPSTTKFVMTSFPDRNVMYPLITVKTNIVNDKTGGLSTEIRFANIGFEIKVYSKSVREKDNLSDSVYTTLRTLQLGADESVANGLYSFKITGMNDIDEEGSAGTHIKIIRGNYTVIAGS